VNKKGARWAPFFTGQLDEDVRAGGLRDRADRRSHGRLGGSSDHPSAITQPDVPPRSYAGSRRGPAYGTWRAPGSLCEDSFALPTGACFPRLLGQQESNEKALPYFSSGCRPVTGRWPTRRWTDNRGATPFRCSAAASYHRRAPRALRWSQIWGPTRWQSGGPTPRRGARSSWPACPATARARIARQMVWEGAALAAPRAWVAHWPRRDRKPRSEAARRLPLLSWSYSGPDAEKASPRQELSFGGGGKRGGTCLESVVRPEDSWCKPRHPARASPLRQGTTAPGKVFPRLRLWCSAREFLCHTATGGVKETATMRFPGETLDGNRAKGRCTLFGD